VAESDVREWSSQHFWNGGVECEHGVRMCLRLSSGTFRGLGGMGRSGCKVGLKIYKSKQRQVPDL